MQTGGRPPLSKAAATVRLQAEAATEECSGTMARQRQLEELAEQYSLTPIVVLGCSCMPRYCDSIRGVWSSLLCTAHADVVWLRVLGRSRRHKVTMARLEAEMDRAHQREQVPRIVLAARYTPA